MSPTYSRQGSNWTARIAWSLLLLAFWGLDIPPGLGSSYRYPAP